MTTLKTINPSEFISWWKEIVNEIYTDFHLKVKLQESLNEDFFQMGFAVKQNEKISGVVALFNNPELNYENNPAACIGKFECVNENPVGKQLINSAAAEAISLNKSFLIGPMDGSTWDAYRYPVFSSNPLILTENIYKDYYADFLIGDGFKVIGKYSTQLDRSLCPDEVKNKKALHFLEPLNLKYRNISPGHFENELSAIYSFCMDAFKNNFLFTPVSEKSFVEKYLKVKPLIDPRYVIIAEHENNIAGIIFCIPEILHPNNKRIIVKTLAKLPEKKFSGLGHVLSVKLYEEAIKNGVQGIYHAFMHQNNASKAMSENFSGEKWRDYILLMRNLRPR